MPHSGIFAFFYIAGKEEWQSIQEIIEHRDSINIATMILRISQQYLLSLIPYSFYQRLLFQITA